MVEAIYQLKSDKQTIKILQRASLDTISTAGLKIENDLLVGSDIWFEAIDTGKIKKHSIKGTISQIYQTGHNDYPQFVLENPEGKTTWTRHGTESAYIIGKIVEVIYVEQRLKRPIAILGRFSKCIIQINIETNS